MTAGPLPASPFELDVLADSRWQMAYGERFALEGIVSQVRPRLAIEIGTAEGGSLRRIAAHADEVHCFDMADTVDLTGRVREHLSGGPAWCAERARELDEGRPGPEIVPQVR